MIQQYFGERLENQTERDQWEFDLRNQALLHRDGWGYYEFAHKSLAEFFVAIKFAAEIGCLSKSISNAFIEADGKQCKLPYKQKNIFELKETFGELSLQSASMQTVREFICEMMAEHSSLKLWKIIDESSLLIPEHAKFCGSNAATILQHTGLWYNREDVKDIFEQFQKHPETVFPLRPARFHKIKEALNKLGFSFSQDMIMANQELTGYNDAIQSFNYLKQPTNFEEASNYAEKAKTLNPKFNEFCLSIQAYIGLQYMYLNMFDKAEFFFSKYLQNGGKKLWYDLKKGFILVQKGSFGEAKSIALESLAESKRSKDKQMEARSLLLDAIIERISGKYDIAINTFKEALNIFSNFNDDYHKGVTLANLGMAYRMQGLFSDAVEHYNESEIIFKELLRDEYLVACVQARRGTAYRLLKQLEKALSDYNSALKVFISNDDGLRAGIVLSELGTTYLILGQWKDAIKNYTHAQRTFRKLEKEVNPLASTRMGITLYSLGLAYFMQGKWNQSIKIFVGALKNHRFDNYHLCLVYSSIGVAFRMNDVPDGALYYLEQALMISKYMEDSNRESLILLKIGGVNRLLHNYDTALKTFNEAFDIVNNLINERNNLSALNKNITISELSLRKGKILGEIGTIYRMQNKLDEAIYYYNNALSIFKNHGDPIKISWILEAIGEVYSIQGFIDKAIAEYSEALNCLPSEGGLVDDSFVSLAEGYIFRGIYKGGIQRYTAALDEIERLGNLSLRGKLLCNLGEALRRFGQIGQAITNIEESQKIFHDIRDRDQEAKSLCYLGLAHSGLAYSNEKIPAEDDDATYTRFSHHEHAVISLKKSIEIFNKIGDHFLEGWALESLGRVYLMQEEWKKAIEILNRSFELNYESRLLHLSLALCYKQLGNQKEFQNQCSKSHDKLKAQGINECDLACYEANCGNIDRAFGYLRVALAQGKTNINLITRDPFAIPICEDKRWKRLKADFLSNKDSTQRVVDVSNIEIIPFM